MPLKDEGGETVAVIVSGMIILRNFTEYSGRHKPDTGNAVRFYATMTIQFRLMTTMSLFSIGGEDIIYSLAVAQAGGIVPLAFALCFPLPMSRALCSRARNNKAVSYGIYVCMKLVTVKDLPHSVGV